MSPADVLGRVLLVTGKEEYLAERVVVRVRGVVRAHDAEAELADTDASSLSLATLGELAAPSLFSTVRCVVVRGLQDLPEDVGEAAALDGATGWQMLWYVTVPQLRSVLFLVVTLGLIGTWQVFDQVYATGGGSPGNRPVRNRE